MDMQQIRPSHFGHIKPLPTLPSLSSNLSSQPKRKRSDSKPSMKPNKVVKKSNSTPNMSKSDGSASSDEKKRSKLGYHRTSVACGHCRRRKIRCVMPDDDPSGRCSNCIRLKKECNFFPVDSSISSKGANPRSSSLPKGGIRTQSPSPMVFNSTGYESFPPYSSHGSYSVPPPDTGLNNLFHTSAAPTFSDATYPPTSYETVATTWESSPYATLPPISAADPSPYGFGLSVSPAPYPRPPSTFRPSPFADSAYGSGSQSKTPSNEIGWAPPQPQHPPVGLASTYTRSFSPSPQSISDSARQSEQPPSLIMGSEAASTPTLSEPTTIGSINAPSTGFWNSIATADGLEHMGKPLSEPFDGTGSWFTEPHTLHSYS